MSDGLTAREEAVLTALGESIRAEDPRLAALLTLGADSPRAVVSRGAGAMYPAGAPYWFWWRRRAAG